MKKVLISTTVSGFVPQFEMNNVRMLQTMGYEVHYATNYNMVSYGKDNHRLDGTGIVRHHIDYTRSPFQIKENIVAYRQLKKLMEQEQFELLHCHTPVAAVLSRLVARKYRKNGMKVAYTAHGFHFFRGASLKYWLMFYTAERLLANFTDVLITINEEDYTRAERFCRHKKTKVVQLPGVGIDTAYWSGQALSAEEKSQLRQEIREELGLKEGQLAMVSVGELIPRKNHREVICALGNLVRNYRADNMLPFHYYICGHGDLQEELKQLIAEEGLEQYVTLLDYREDMRRVLFGMDLFLFPSKQEGMPMAMLEAVTAGLPVIARDARGNRDIVKVMGPKGQTYTKQDELEQLLMQILVEQKEVLVQEAAIDMSPFDSAGVKETMQGIYNNLLENKES